MSSLSVGSQQSTGSFSGSPSYATGSPDSAALGSNTGAIGDQAYQDNAGSIEAQGPEEYSQDRSQTRSPVSFREGRRASDGLVAQGIFAFRQRLQNCMRAEGMIELRQEHQHLQHMYSGIPTQEQVVQLQQQHSDYLEKNCRQWSLEDNQSGQMPRPPRPLMKRMSLPSETFDMQPHRLLAIKQSMQVERELDRVTSNEELAHQGSGQSYAQQFDYAMQNKPLQQQLMHNRLQQKRQTFQKQCQLQHQFQQMHIVPGDPANQIGSPYSTKQRLPGKHEELNHLGRPPVIRKISYKLAQQQPVMPPLSDVDDVPWQQNILPPTQEHDGQEDDGRVPMQKVSVIVQHQSQQHVVNVAPVHYGQTQQHQPLQISHQQHNQQVLDYQQQMQINQQRQNQNQTSDYDEQDVPVVHHSPSRKNAFIPHGMDLALLQQQYALKQQQQLEQQQNVPSFTITGAPLGEEVLIADIDNSHISLSIDAGQIVSTSPHSSNESLKQALQHNGVISPASQTPQDGGVVVSPYYMVAPLVMMTEDHMDIS